MISRWLELNREAWRALSAPIDLGFLTLEEMRARGIEPEIYFQTALWAGRIRFHREFERRRWNTVRALFGIGPIGGYFLVAERTAEEAASSETRR